MRHKCGMRLALFPTRPLYRPWSHDETLDKVALSEKAVCQQSNVVLTTDSLKKQKATNISVRLDMKNHSIT